MLLFCLLLADHFLRGSGLKLLFRWVGKLGLVAALLLVFIVALRLGVELDLAASLLPKTEAKLIGVKKSASDCVSLESSK